MSLTSRLAVQAVQCNPRQLAKHARSQLGTIFSGKAVGNRSVAKNGRRHWTCAVLVERETPERRLVAPPLPAQLPACEHQGSTVCPTSCSGGGPQRTRAQLGYRSFAGRRQHCVCMPRTGAQRWPRDGQHQKISICRAPYLRGDESVATPGMSQCSQFCRSERRRK